MSPSDGSAVVDYDGARDFLTRLPDGARVTVAYHAAATGGIPARVPYDRLLEALGFAVA